MSLVGKVGRKRPRARLAMGFLYALLLVGAVTTLYPFLMMLTTGFKGPTDQNDNKLIPSFWRDDTELLAKYRDDKYAGDASLMAASNVGATAPGEDTATYRKFLMDLPLDMWHAGFRTPSNHVTSKLNLRWQDWLKDRYPNIEALNGAFVEVNGAFQQVVPPSERFDRKVWQPTPGKKWDDWLLFKAPLPAEYRIPLRSTRLYQEYLRSKFENQFKRVPAEVAAGATKFEELTLPSSGPLLTEFREKGLPAQFQTNSVEERWAAVSDQPMPIAADETDEVQQRGSELRREMSGRNYRYVLDFILVNGRAVFNTAMFCLLVILTQLTVNPLAAYALSRFPMKATAKILLFLLATMAFPAEVAMIPSFLLLKDLNLLNTFAALVLPGAASGYMIFLLKGFFDSLPQEIFESGQIDGASEWTMMLRMAFPLSKPVLGYLALLAFMGAYGSFMYAFLVAQDRDMWTLMVFIYQLQQTAPKAVMMAAITLAALPTLIVFLFAQRVIMRGIVLPGER